MRSRRAVFILLIVIVALFLFSVLLRLFLPQPTLVNGENMAVAQRYELNNTIDDSLVIFAEDVALLPDSHVTGDAAFVSSDVVIEGRIDGDLTVTSENFALHPGAFVGGDITVIANSVWLDGEVGGDVTFSGDQILLEPGVVFGGSIALCSGEILDQRADGAIETLPCADVDIANLIESFRANLMLQSGTASTDSPGRLVFALGSTVIAAFLLAGLTTLSVSLFPHQLGTMEHALRRPQNQLLTGVLTLLLLVGLGTAVIVLLALIPALGIVLVPLSLLAGLLVIALIVAGVIPMTLGLGGWLLGRFSDAPWPPLVTASLGSVVLVLVIGLPVLVPYGALVSLAVFGVVGLVAVGAALNTRLGTRSKHPRLMVQG